MTEFDRVREAVAVAERMHKAYGETYDESWMFPNACGVLIGYAMATRSDPNADQQIAMLTDYVISMGQKIGGR